MNEPAAPSSQKFSFYLDELALLLDRLVFPVDEDFHRWRRELERTQDGVIRMVRIAPGFKQELFAERVWRV